MSEVRSRARTAEPTPHTVGPGLQAVIQQVEKTHGAGIIRPGTQLENVPHIPTDIFMLDMALFGGLPEGQISMVYGWEASGKTLVSMRAVAAAQRKYPDRTAVFVDVEGTFAPDWARRHGVDPEKLLVVHPRSGEQAVDIADAVLRATETSLVVIDSLPALVPLKEVEQSAEDSNVALQARLIGRFTRKATQALLDQRKVGHLPTLLLVNQFRNRITMMGDPRTLPGGNSLKYVVYTRIELMNKETLGKDQYDVETVDYNEHSFKITKNKAGNGIRTGEFTMIRNPSHPRGPGFIDEGKTVLTYAKRFGLFSGGGSSWHLDGVEQRFGKIQDTIDWLYDHPEAMAALKHRLIAIQREHAGLSPEGWY